MRAGLAANALLVGDEFVVVLRDEASCTDATLVAERIIGTMVPPFTVDIRTIDQGEHGGRVLPNTPTTSALTQMCG